MFGMTALIGGGIVVLSMSMGSAEILVAVVVLLWCGFAMRCVAFVTRVKDGNVSVACMRAQNAPRRVEMAVAAESGSRLAQ